MNTKRIPKSPAMNVADMIDRSTRHVERLSLHIAKRDRQIQRMQVLHEQQFKKMAKVQKLLRDAEEKVMKLQAFKDFVHSRLDGMGIPSHPDGIHSAAGCRIGDRLDIIQSSIQKRAS